jgi:hypothetical protein
MFSKSWRILTMLVARRPTMLDGRAARRDADAAALSKSQFKLFNQQTAAR